MFAGIDPGRTGALVVLDDRGSLLLAKRVPLVGKEFDEPEMVRLLTEFAIAGCAIERVSAMPGQGVTSMFTFGAGFGLWRGMLAALRIPYELASPQTWQKAMLQGRSSGGDEPDKAKRLAIRKASCVAAAKALWPAIPIRVKADYGMADAALMAEWGRRRHAGVEAIAS